MMLKSSEIPNVRFQPTKFREGYDMGQVDAFLAQVQLSLAACERRAAPDLRTTSVTSIRFSPTTFRTGYDQDQVDDFLDTVSATLTSYGY